MPFVQADDYEIYYEVHGEGEAVICPGGWSILTGEGHGRLPASLRENYRTIVYDHRGLGRSTDNGAPLSTVDLAKDAARVIDAAGLDRAHVFGHGGLGACLSQHLAASFPDRVGALMLVAGWAGPDPFKRAQHDMGQYIFDIGGFDAYRRFGALLIYTPEYYNANERQILSDEGAWGEFEGTDLAALRRVQHATAAHDARDALPRIKSPTLVVHGELDQVDPPRLGRQLVSLIPRARLAIIGNTPHSMRSYPEGFAELSQLVDDFIKAHPIANFLAHAGI